MADRTEALISRIEKWCEAKRGRQSQIAVRLSVDRQTVNEWIKRRRKPTSEQTLALIEFLDSQEHDEQE
jgi:DNA-binding transcriptional regulator YiaG